jgi:hypothetical protein
MTVESDGSQHRKKFFANFLGLALMSLALTLAYILVNQSDNKILEQKSKYRMTSTLSPVHFNEFSIDEERIAKLFVTDTLPGLMQRGLIKKYERNESGTFLKVAGILWKKRSVFFKQSLLTEVFVHNKVNGYEPSTEVVDYRTGKLYASISTSAKMKFYD